ncbi:MAG: hypothetical protein ACOCRK_11460 [bacterium]
MESIDLKFNNKRVPGWIFQIGEHIGIKMTKEGIMTDMIIGDWGIKLESIHS